MKNSVKLAAGAAIALVSLFNVATAQTVEPEAAVEAAAAATDIRLSCSANGVRDFSMAGKYRLRRGSKSFGAEFEAAPTVGFRVGQVLNIAVGGVAVGRITLKRDPVNGDVIGGLEYSSNPDDRKPFPANFPAVRAGTSVTVGPLGCALR